MQQQKCRRLHFGANFASPKGWRHVGDGELTQRLVNGPFPQAREKICVIHLTKQLGDSNASDNYDADTTGFRNHASVDTCGRFVKVLHQLTTRFKDVKRLLEKMGGGGCYGSTTEH